MAATVIDTQARFAAALARDLDHPDTAAARADFLAEVRDAGRIGARAGLAIYRNNIKAARLRALETMHPVCVMVLGQSAFRAFARDFIDAHPSTDPDLNADGEGLASHLDAALAERARAEFEGAAFDGLGYLPDLARLEWQHHALHFVADDPSPDPGALHAQLANTDPARLTLIPSTSLRAFRSPWPVYALWRAHREGTPLPARIEADHLALWRAPDGVRIQALDPDAHALLVHLLGGASLAMLVAQTAATQLGDWLTRGWVVGARERRP